MSEHDQQRRAGKRQRGGERDHAARRRKRGLERNDDQPDRGKGFDAAGGHRQRHDQTRQRQRRQHMGALVAAGARQEPRQQNGRDQPGERRDLERARRAAHRQIDRECRERRQASEQPRRHEGAMARARQRVVARRGMQQRIETIADDTQNCHGSRASAGSSKRRAGTPPLSLRPPCQSEIKRTLRRGEVAPAKTASSRGFSRRARRSFDADGERRVSRAQPVWFRNGGRRPRFAPFRGKPPSIENLHRIKSCGFFANFRRFNLNANTCDLSTAVSQTDDCGINRNGTKRRPGSRDVFSASHGILARAGARAAAEGEDT